MSNTRADVIDNLSGSTVGHVSINEVNGTIWAQSFSFDNDVELDRVTLKISNVSIGSGFQVALVEDNSGLPGNVMVSLTGNPAPQVNSLEDYQDASNTLLLANTPYWFVMSTSLVPGNLFTVSITSDSTPTIGNGSIDLLGRQVWTK